MNGTNYLLIVLMLAVGIPMFKNKIERYLIRVDKA